MWHNIVCHWETKSQLVDTDTSPSILCDSVSKVEVDHVGLVCSLHTDRKRLKWVENESHKTFGWGRLEAMMTGENLEAKQTRIPTVEPGTLQSVTNYIYEKDTTEQVGQAI